jgi:hypothetical protein
VQSISSPQHGRGFTYPKYSGAQDYKSCESGKIPRLIFAQRGFVIPEKITLSHE